MWQPSVPTVGAVHDLATSSTGSTLLDAGVGAAVGYALAPAAARRAVWVGAGALLGALGGVLGLGLVAGYALLRRA